jgi:class 3 adenylate cyclase
MTLRQARICKGCWQRVRVPIPLRGVISVPFRIFGLRPSRMNPNLRTLCERRFEWVMHARNVTINAIILFADLRNYTGMSQSLSPVVMSELLDIFYDSCAGAIWEQDGLLNKTLGDAVMAVFNFPIKHADHARRAVLVAQDIQRRCRDAQDSCTGAFADGGNGIAVGIGISTGEVSFGEFGQAHRDLTAIGSVVNSAARAQSAAAPGQILVTQAVVDSAPAEFAGSQAQQYLLRGFTAPTVLYAANRNPSEYVSFGAHTDNLFSVVVST